MSYLRDMHRFRYDQTALRNGKVDFMKSRAIKLLGNVGLIPCLQSSQQPHQVSKECHFLAGARTSGYIGDLMKRNLPTSTGIAAMSDG